MDVSRKKILVPGILFVILTVGSIAYASEPAFNLKAHKHSLYLDMVYQVSTRDGYSEKALHSGYPWEGGMIVGCGWVAITYGGFEIKSKRDIENPSSVEERDVFQVNVAIGQGCDFADYLASPINPKKFDVVKWKDEYYLLKE